MLIYTSKIRFYADFWLVLAALTTFFNNLLGVWSLPLTFDFPQVD